MHFSQALSNIFDLEPRRARIYRFELSVSKNQTHSTLDEIRYNLAIISIFSYGCELKIETTL